VLNETFSNIWITQHIDKIRNSEYLVLSQKQCSIIALIFHFENSHPLFFRIIYTAFLNTAVKLI
jgi:hypothetical protein